MKLESIKKVEFDIKQDIRESFVTYTLKYFLLSAKDFDEYQNKEQVREVLYEVFKDNNFEQNYIDLEKGKQFLGIDDYLMKNTEQALLFKEYLKEAIFRLLNKKIIGFGI